jgi:hypothetical protein
MNRRAAIQAMLAAPLGFRSASLSRAPTHQGAWSPLFNGRDLSGWDTWLGKLLPGQRGHSPAEYAEPVGLNKDPRDVFSVVDVDGEAAIRISGETYGGLITHDEYENYHLRFEFKWGEKKWPPREHAVRDSGCCYHSIGPHDASYGFWMKSFEFQIQEGDCGDFFSLAGVIVDAEAVPHTPDNPKSDLVYKKGSPKIIGTTKRIIREPGNERATGAWNSLELYCLGQTSVHVVNGKVNMVLTGLRHRVHGGEVPLTKGRIQFQSEGAEVFYRNIGLRRINEIPGQGRSG